MIVEAVTDRDEANPTGTRVHNMKKEVDVKSGACSQEKLENNKLCRSSGPEQQVRSEHVCKFYHQNKNKT